MKVNEGWKVRTFEPDRERTAFIPLLLEWGRGEEEGSVGARAHLVYLRKPTHPVLSPEVKKLTPATTLKVLLIDPLERTTVPADLAKTRAKKLLAGQRYPFTSPFCPPVGRPNSPAPQALAVLE